ncbi:hypothetical protein VB773_01020 [Haloarculaceae archaeon H-GB2-1]|nr:hypothetical protein [Haloarculaceae archaeon H-GB1-1]MEA5406301.1 hypothetical protein [Haloarculaceae archaeon H-GB2-1]
MSNDTDNAPTTASTLNPDYDTLEDAVESVEDAIEAAEDLVDNHEQFEPLDDQKETIEDLIDSAQDHDDPDRLEGAEEVAHQVRTLVDDVQDDVGFDDAETAEALDELQDQAYDLEEALEDLDTSWSPFVVITKRYSVPERHMTPKEILQEVPGHTPNEEVLYWKHDGAAGGDDYIPADQEIDLLLDGNVFTAYDHENPYGREDEQ